MGNGRSFVLKKYAAMPFSSVVILFSGVRYLKLLKIKSRTTKPCLLFRSILTCAYNMAIMQLNRSRQSEVKKPSG